MVLLAPAAQASSALWCIGFSDCASKGYSDSQYSKYWGNMYWLMYSGRNCVNYAAFREVQAGMPNVRPWNGSGNAEAWGWDNPSITDHTPRVGSIAWWTGGAQGAGSLGHVAYVERVLSPTEIVVSESNWGSDFDWRYINTSQNWPTGFIHWTDRPLVPTVKPSVPGTPAVNDVINSVAGSWPAGTSLWYQWNVAGRALPGANSSRYRPLASQLGQQLSVTITASRTGYRSTTLTVGPRAAIAPGTLDGLTSPAISGIVQVGQTLSVSTPQISPRPDATTVQWYANGAAIPGATGSTFTPTQSQNGAILTAAFMATRQAFTPLTTVSTGTIPVISPPIVLNAAGGISGSNLAQLPLAASPGTYNPADAAVGYQWLRNGAVIPGATSQTYVPVAADLAQKLGVTVSLTKAKYLNQINTYSDPTPIRSLSTLVASSRGGENLAEFIVKASAYGTVPTGQIVITVGPKRFTGNLVKGVAVIVGRDLPTGTIGFSVAYAGDAKTVASTSGGSVRILPSSMTQTVIDHVGTVTGPLAAGGTLKAPSALYAPWNSTLTYQWLRDGAPIRGANGPTYLLTHADSGHLVTVVETAQHAGLQPSSAVFAPVGPVIADPQFAARTLGGAGRATATVTVMEMGKFATGSVKFSSGTVSVTRTLVRGTATGILNGLPSGARTITVSYSGDTLTAAGAISRPVQVLPKLIGTKAELAPEVIISGAPRVGSEVTVQLKAYAPWAGQLSYQWLRDGQPIAGATRTTYLIQNIDAGHALSLRATLKVSGFTSATVIYKVTGVITAPAVMGVVATPTANQVQVQVQVTAAGLPATGTVRLVAVGTTRQVVGVLNRGVVTLTMTSVRPGAHTFDVIYTGSQASPATHRLITVRV